MKSLHGLVGLLLSASLASAGLVPRDASIPIVNQDSKNAVSNRYLVAFDPRLSKDVIKAERAKMIDTVKKRNVDKRSTDNRPLSQNPYTFDIDGKTQGMIIEADDATIQTFAKSGALASIECDTRGSYDAQVSQSNAPDNLVRLSNNVIDGVSNYNYDESGGEGITVYVFDGGIRLTHEEFGGRATFGATFSTDSPNEDVADDHGTHIAGIIGGAKFGVAKKVKLVAVKLDNEASQMIQAVDFVLEDVKKKGIQGKAVISMSMHNDPSDILDQKFKHAVDSGVVVVVSAGNNNADAGNYSPGRHPSIITVAAMYHKTDFHWPNSNWGSAVTIYAPGVGIESAATWSDSATRYYDGTSQAAPHVAGLAAYIMALEAITEPPKVMARLISLAEETGSRVHWTDPNTTTLIATNGLAGRLDPAIANKVKKLPWIADEDASDWGSCGRFYDSDLSCGTLVYCDSYDTRPTLPKKGFFKSAQECFDAHGPAPILPWIEKPTTVRPDTCDKSSESAQCPRVCGSGGYDEYVCGTKFVCEGFDLNPKPDWAKGYKNAKACFDAHAPQPVSSN
ncbi:Subtilisin-like protease 2 [Metarhizium anisopliae]|nr:Subtilisin-like protease 2 [Metarhizium anisopliae]